MCHTQNLALFDRKVQAEGGEVSAAHTTVDHIAFTIESSDYEAEKQRLEGLGLAVSTAEHKWVHWRSMYVFDPEGNEVELACYDANV